MMCRGFIGSDQSFGAGSRGVEVRVIINAVQPLKQNMKTTDLVFIGIKGSVVALNRETGQQVWSKALKGSQFVNVVLERGVILASCQGEIFCLDPLTGNRLWHNPLRGYGMGLATIATENTTGNANALVQAEKRRRDDEAASSAAVVAATTF
jgi:outer membrane protein assembly factor BamB